MAIEIVDFPIKIGDFPLLYVYQRVFLLDMRWPWPVRTCLFSRASKATKTRIAWRESASPVPTRPILSSPLDVATLVECIGMFNGSIDFGDPRKLGVNFTEYQAVGMKYMKYEQWKRLSILRIMWIMLINDNPHNQLDNPRTNHQPTEV